MKRNDENRSAAANGGGLTKCTACEGKGGWVNAEWIDPVSGPECDGERCSDCEGTGIAPPAENEHLARAFEAEVADLFGGELDMTRTDGGSYASRPTEDM